METGFAPAILGDLRSEMLQASANALRHLLDIFGLLDFRYRDDVRFVLFQFRLQVCRELYELTGVFQGLFVFLFGDRIALRFAVGELGIGLLLAGSAWPGGDRLLRKRAGQ